MTQPKFSAPVPPDPEVVRVRMAAWYRAMEFSHEMLMAGLRDRIGPDGDIQEAYRKWNEDRRSRKWRHAEEDQNRNTLPEVNNDAP